MNSAKRSGCAALATMAGLAVGVGGLAHPVLGDDKSWNSNSGVWTEAASWWPVGVPAPADHVSLGNITGVHNDTVTLNQNDTVAGVTISDGMRLLTGGFRLLVNGDTLITGQNMEGINVYSSVLHVYDGPTLIDYETHGLTVVNEAVLYMNTGTVRASEAVTIGSSSALRGNGSIELEANGTSFVNAGRIEPGHDGGLVLTQLADGAFDLDGATGSGVIDVDHEEGSEIFIHGDRLSDPFSGVIEVRDHGRLHMDLDEGWAVDAAGILRLDPVSAVWEQARITGSPLNFAGTMEASATVGFLQVECDIEFEPTAHVEVGVADTLRFLGDTVVNGGEFISAVASDLRFEGPTVMRGGEFTNPNGALVRFFAPTEWDGTVEFSGYVNQIGPAHVTGPTVINAALFDMDGDGATPWTISAGLTVNAAVIDNVPGRRLGGPIIISGGIPARLTINLGDPEDAWTMDAPLTLVGDANLYMTRLAGSPVSLVDAVSITGRVNISAPTTFAEAVAVSFAAPSAVLRMLGDSDVGADTIFLGAGTLHNGAAGVMTLENGVGTAGVGLVNQGTLRIGSAAGIAAVDRLQMSGAWDVQIGGYAAGAEHDRLIVSGGGSATLGGTLSVELIDGFRPVVGDTFTILTSVGGVNGAFPADAVSSTDGYTYEWTVLTNANDVRLRLDVVIPPPCSADFNGDGVVNSQDFFDFLARFFAADPLADFNSDGVVNSQDFFDFLTVFFKGCH